MNDTSGSSEYVRAASTLWRRTLDGVVLLPPDSHEVVHVTGAGQTVWALLAEPATTAELVHDLADIYGREPADVRADVESVLCLLVRAGAVTGGPAGVGPPSPDGSARGAEPT